MILELGCRIALEEFIIPGGCSEGAAQSSHFTHVKTEIQRGRATKETGTQSGLGFLTVGPNLFPPLQLTVNVLPTMLGIYIPLHQLSFQYSIN